MNELTQSGDLYEKGGYVGYGLWCCSAAVFAISLSVNAQSDSDVIVIRAPIDGRVVAGPIVGATLSAAVSPAQHAFASTDARVTSALEAAVDKRILENQLKLERNSRAKASPEKIPLLFDIRSDVLGIQLQLEQAKLDLAERKLKLAMRNLTDEEKLHALELAREESRRVASRYQSAIYFRQLLPTTDPEIPGYSSMYIKSSQGLADQQAEAFKARTGHQLAIEKMRISIAESELLQAKLATDLIAATTTLGQITCPRTCSVVRIFAIAGQFVTKGDPLAEVRFH